MTDSVGARNTGTSAPSSSPINRFGFDRRAILVMLAGGGIVLIAMGLRQSLGLYLAPVSDALGVGRETFSLAMAVQNLVLGIPIAGLIADRIGGRRVAVTGALIYAGGLVMVSQVSSGVGLVAGLGLVAGTGLSATSYVVVLGAVGRVVPAERRSTAFGLITAAGSFGMFSMVPVSQALLSSLGWRMAFLGLAALVGLVALLAFALPTGPNESTGPAVAEPFAEIMLTAVRNRSYLLLNVGFFVCGFHVAFIATHLPAYLTDAEISDATVALSLAMIGLFNIVGSTVFGRLGDQFRKRTLLSILYSSRALVFTVFLVAPLTQFSAVVFGAAIGFLWLGTVPLTSGTVATIFGTRNLGLLYGFVFLSHQIGAFLGVWLGGRIFDTTGGYGPVWLIAIALGVLAAIVHIPIDERPLEVASIGVGRD